MSFKEYFGAFCFAIAQLFVSFGSVFKKHWKAMVMGVLLVLCLMMVLFGIKSDIDKIHAASTSRFEVVEEVGHVGGRTLYIIRDVSTGERYIITSGGGICPLIEPEAELVPIENNIDIPIDDYKDAARYLAKAVYGEARGCSTTQQAAVIWCVLNRVDTDNGYSPEEVINVVTKKSQFHGYDPNHPVTDEYYSLAIDVLSRWLREKNGETDVGRVLPKDYLYFGGDGTVNRFRTEWEGGRVWDWSLKSPYEEV